MTIMTINIAEAFIQPEWPAPSTIKAYTSLRQSGVGLPAHVDRERLTTLLQLPHALNLPKQIHGAVAIAAEQTDAKIEADAVFTTQTQKVCAIQTADCLPVLMTNRAGTHVAAIHAGWRGLAAGILEVTLRQLQVPAEDMLVWLGPAIGPGKFEVRQDVYDVFTQHDAQAAAAFQKINAYQWLADLYLLARQRLVACHVKSIFGGGYCTFTDEERFFSYRRDGKMTGRMVSTIWITESTEGIKK
jgi:YfiH family protein